MSNGGYKGASPARETSPEQYPGVWELTEQFQAQADGNWPFQAADCAPKSLRFNSADSAQLTRSVNAEGDRKTWTWSGWVKRHKFGVVQRLFSVAGAATNNDSWFALVFLTDDKLYLGGYSSFFRSTAGELRDPSAWMHVHVVAELNHTVSSEKLRIYINGERSDNGTGSEPSLTGINDNVTHHLGSENNGNFCDVSLSEVQFIDGQALEPDAFTFVDGQGILQPKRFTGDYSSGPVYSNYLTSSGGFASATEGPDKAFDGIADTTSRVKATQDAILTFDISSFGFTGSFELWSQNSGAEFSIDGGSNWSAIGNNAWTTVSSDISGVSSIQMRPSPGARMKVSAFRSQGQLLFDALVGRNSFKLDFSGGVKDQSGLVNDWTANNIDAGTPRIETTGDITLSSQNRNFFFKGAVGQSIGVAVGNHVWDSADGVSWSYRGQSGASVTLTTAYVEISGTTNIAFTNTNSDSVVYWDAALGHGLPNGSGSGSAETFDVEANGSDGADKFVDSPVNGNEASTGAGGERRGNYCTWNPLDQVNATLTNGNLDCSLPANASNYTRGTISVTSGKWYWEVTLNSGVHGMIGISQQDYPAALSYTQGVLFYYVSNGNIYGNVGRSGTYSSYGNGLSAGDVLGIALDMDNGNVKFYKNGTAEGGNANSSTLRGLTISPCLGEGGGAMTTSTNFGQRSFSQTPPTGYSPLATSFLPEPTIKRGDEGFDIALWQGNGGVQTIGNLRLNPGLVWIKSRDDAYGSALYDQVRGANLRLRTDDQGGTNPDQTQTNGLSAFTEDGFTLGSHNAINESPDDYVGWIWGGGETTTTVSVGALDSSVYNQSSIWSASSGISNPQNAFDGDLATGGVVNSSGTAITVTTASFTGRKIRFYKNGNNDAQLTTITINGTAYTFPLQSTSTGWVEVDLGSSTNVTSFTTTWYGNYTLHAIEVDGKILADAINASQTWSNSLTSSGSFSTNNGASLAFDGDTTTLCQSNANSETLTFAPSGGITYSTSVEVYTYASNGQFTTTSDGAQTVSWTSTYQGWKTIASGGGTFTSTVLNSTNTGVATSRPTIAAIRVDGKFLVDPGQNTAPSVPSIATTVRANPSTGLSIMTLTFPVYSGTSSVAHGLNSAPHFWVMKDRDSADGWYVGHKSMSAGHYLRIESDGDKGASQYLWDSRLPDANVIYNNGTSMTGSGSYLMLAWAPVDGFSAFGSYIGSSSYPFIFTGFRPALLVIKRTDSTGAWKVLDTSRSPSNVASKGLDWSTSGTEFDNAENNVDILSNGFKLRNTHGARNASGGTYIYMAWAEHPFASNCRAR